MFNRSTIIPEISEGTSEPAPTLRIRFSDFGAEFSKMLPIVFQIWILEPGSQPPQATLSGMNTLPWSTSVESGLSVNSY